MHPRLSRALYRSFLRASHGGKHPEVFGRHGAAVFALQSHVNGERASLALPVNDSQVRMRLKEWFRGTNAVAHDDALSAVLLRETKATPLDVLRQTLENEAMLYSNASSSHTRQHLKKPPVVPIFDYSDLAALPGERINTLFLEPRYTAGLLPMLVDSYAPKLFLLRSGHVDSSRATVVKLLSHQHVTLPANAVGMGNDHDIHHNELSSESGRMISGVAVTGVAGARVKISREEHISVCKGVGEEETREGSNTKCWSESTAPLALATELHITVDQDHSSFHSMKYQSTRQYVLNLIECILAFHNADLAGILVQTGFGLPPLDPEAFSFWALRFVLERDDMMGRKFWLHNCHSSAERLQYVIIQMEAILDAQAEEDEEERIAVARFG